MDDNEDMVLVHSSDVVWVPEDSLAHYGVPGMKWGKRSGGSFTDRAKGSALDRNNRKTRYAKTLKNITEKPKSKKEAIGKALLLGNVGVGPGRMLVNKYATKRITKLENSKAKIESGNRKVRNIMGTSAAGLVISSRFND